MRPKRLRRVAIGFTMLLVVEIASCRVYDALVLPTEADGLVRKEVDAPSGWVISYIRRPPGPIDQPRLIYVHGTPGDATAFEEFLLDPIPGFDAVSIDRPGFGHSRPRRPALTLDKQAQSLEPFLESTGERKPILVGHSLGAPIVLRAAVNYPERVGGLVLISASVDPALEKIAWYQRLAAYVPVSWMIPRFLRNANRELFPLKGELKALADDLNRLRCPVAIVHAPDDILVAYENVAYMKKRFPKGTIVDVITLEGKNHFIPWNAENDVKKAIRTVARAAEPAPGRQAERTRPTALGR